MPHEMPFSPDEIEILEVAKECEEFVVTPMWRKLEKFLSGMVEEMESAMMGNHSSNPVISHNLRIKWMERQLLRDRITNFVKGPLAAKKQILEQLQEEMKYARPNT